MKAVIIEDEQLAAQSLNNLIKELDPQITILAILQSIEESVEWFLLHPMPDLVFMDIHLADGSSFSISDEINIGCPIIFTTAYDEYALKAFHVNSIDYLLKPINRRDLERAINKYKNFTPRPDQSNDKLAQLLAEFKQSNTSYKSYFLIPYKDKLIPLATNDIAYLYIDNKMVKVSTFTGQSHYLDATLDELMSTLDPDKFFRANRQFIIAHQAIKEISIWFGSKLSVNLTVGTPEKIIVSKARVPEFKTWYTR
ncbi:MAG: LytTR family DNA-binding domain-containing protein [Prevotellaceae bacterium]|jgi:two-component system LytT family response regulator|nr:LytTR family DNA-binding domain-containing protein [Prevotellaceae bacterium]